VSICFTNSDIDSQEEIKKYLQKMNIDDDDDDKSQN